MSNADSEEVSVVVERGGVTVEKSFEPDDFPVPAIAFVIHSDREETTNVRIVDQVPDDVPAQDIGFHPKYGADFWSVEDGEIVFERDFEAGEEYTTVYGLRAKDTDEVERFLTDPTIEGVEGEATVSDIIGDDPADETGDSGGDEADQEPVDTSIDLNDPTGSDDESEAEAADDARGPEPVEASADELESAIADVDEVEGEATEAEESAAGGDGEGEVSAAVGAVDEQPESASNGASAAAAPEDLAAALATEIRSGEVADEDLETLREALGAELDADEDELPGHIEAKLDKLQADVDDVVAYTGALESFLDDAGTADDILEMREDVEALRGSVDDLEGTVTGMDDRLDDVSETTGALEGSVEALHDDVADLEAGMADLREELADLEDELGEDLSGRVEALEDELDEMEDDIKTLDNLRQALAGD